MQTSEIQAEASLKLTKPDEIPHILMPGELGAVLELILTDTRTGKVFDRRIQKSESFVRQFIQMLYLAAGMIPRAEALTMIDTSNTPRTQEHLVQVGTQVFHHNTNAGSGVVNYGIVVGTSSAAVNITDYQLGARINHGAGAGQLQYSATTYGAPTSDATTSQFTITRNFSNASGAGITVNEIGLYYTTKDSGGDRYYCSIRDVISGGITIPNGQTLTINYRIQASI